MASVVCNSGAVRAYAEAAQAEAREAACAEAGRALTRATHAEQPRPVSVTVYPGGFISGSSQAWTDMLKTMDAAIAHSLIGGPLPHASIRHEAIVEPAPPPAAFSARCPRCGGPATELVTSVACERVGGCRTMDERMGEPPVFREYGGSRHEWFWTTTDATDGWCAAEDALSHPTREGAIALWRERRAAELRAEDAK